MNLKNIFFIPFIQCFYKQGHELIGTLVDNILDETVKNNINMSIKDISPWADSVRRNPEYRWLEPLHFINTEDFPDKNICNVNTFESIKPNLYNALQNYTQKLMNSYTRTEEDLKIFVHLYQDLFQPLHMSGVFRGGNSYKTDFFGRKTNLHQVWDSLILRNRINEFDNYHEYLNVLLSNYTVFEPFNFKFWISHNNKLNCNNVYYNVSDKISTKYYNINKILLEKLIITASLNLKYILEFFFNSIYI